jgi:hypothetical protein
MNNDHQNRMAAPANRGPGRPPGTDRVLPAAQPATVDTTQRTVPPLIAPCCGRGMTPRLERWEVAGTHKDQASCLCTLCGGRFYYDPAKVILKHG